MQIIKKQKVQTLVRGAIAPLFDRLTDEEPDLLEEDPVTYILTAEGLKASIRRELELILNTRPTSNLSGQTRFNDTELRLPTAFGLPEFAWTDTIHDHSLQTIAQVIEQTITAFEPRLKGVQVTVTGKNPQTLGLMLHISAQLQINDTHERVHFPLTINNILKR
jgi:type VI secretion system protein ImpF